MRAISFFNRDAGTSTFGWRAIKALRTRVSISATGSAVIYLLPSAPFITRWVDLPTSLRDTRNLAGKRELTEADPAQRELAQEAPRSSAVFAAIPQTHFELGRFFFFSDFCGSCHYKSSSFTGGMAYPCGAAAPILQHRSSRWS